MGLFSNPLGHAGYPPNPQSANRVNSTVRAATAAEAAAGTLNDVYISPATESSSVALDFASPPVLGFGSTTPRPVHATTLSSAGTTTLNTSGAANTNIGTSTNTGIVSIGNATGGVNVPAGNFVMTLGNISTAAGSITSATTMTATLGDITATNGNFVSSTAGKGLQFNANTATGAAASPVVLNSRAGQVVFTSVSIAAAADLTLTITNSAITGATTQVIYSMSGATTGAALSIKSVTNTAGSSAIVVTNGTGATTTTADITLNFIVVN